jgi:hypothetical protein
MTLAVGNFLTNWVRFVRSSRWIHVERSTVHGAHPVDCKSVQPGSTPGRASTYEDAALLGVDASGPDGELLGRRRPIFHIASESLATAQWL